MEALPGALAGLFVGFVTGCVSGLICMPIPYIQYISTSIYIGSIVCFVIWAKFSDPNNSNPISDPVEITKMMAWIFFLLSFGFSFILGTQGPDAIGDFIAKMMENKK